MQLNPFLTFDGRCEEAFRFYAEVLGGKIVELVRYEGSSAAQHVPPHFHQKLMGARLEIEGQSITASDWPPDAYEKPRGVYVQLHFDNNEKASRIFDALTEGGTVQMPFGPLQPEVRLGMAMDRYGTPWMIYCKTSV